MDAYNQLRQKNAAAYGLLFDIEVLLRELLAKRLEDAHGAKWPKRGLPADIQPKVTSAIAYDRAVAWHKAVPHHPLYYVDFPDLKKIIINGANWTTIFSNVFVQKSGTEVTLSDLETLRNKVAHNRFITDADLKILEGIHLRLISSISLQDLNRAKSSATDRTPILICLQKMAQALQTVASIIVQGDPLPPDILLPLSSSQSWWFDDTYLGVPTSDVEAFITLCTDYVRLPRGVGQAYRRREWGDARSANEVAHRATEVLTQRKVVFNMRRFSILNLLRRS
jgi:hypothetical protein